MTIKRRTALGAAATIPGVTVLTACGGDEQGGGSDGGPVRVPVADVPEGGGVVQGEVVVTQPEPGTYEAFDATCPHQGCAVNEVTEQEITCPCHGSTFDTADGEVVQGPATSGLTRMKATVEGDEVVVS